MWVEIPLARIADLGLFGYDNLGEDWWHGPIGRQKIDPERPVVWVEDESDAMLLEAIAIIPGPC